MSLAEQASAGGLPKVAKNRPTLCPFSNEEGKYLPKTAH
jgi:hypothetical protein